MNISRERPALRGLEPLTLAADRFRFSKSRVMHGNNEVFVGDEMVSIIENLMDRAICCEELALQELQK